MSTQIFLYIDIQGNAIRGEATARAYENEIEVESFSWGMKSQAGVRADKTRALARATYDSLVITKLYDMASPNLSRYLARGARFDQACLTVDHHAIHAKDKKSANPLMVLDLSDGFIEDVRLSMSEGSKGASIKEVVELSFTKIDVLYYPSGRDRNARREAPTTFTGRQPVDKL